jgi:hypothetical protein
MIALCVTCVSLNRWYHCVNLRLLDELWSFLPVLSRLSIIPAAAPALLHIQVSVCCTRCQTEYHSCSGTRSIAHTGERLLYPVPITPYDSVTVKSSHSYILRAVGMCIQSLWAPCTTRCMFSVNLLLVVRDCGTINYSCPAYRRGAAS